MAATIRRVTNPTEAELDSAAQALSESFAHSYFVEALGGDKSLVPAFLRMHLTTALIGGKVYFAEVPGQGIVGAGIWFGPGQKFLNSDDQRNAGWNQIMQKLDKKYIDWWDYFIETYDNLCENSLGSGVKLAAYHCQVLGVVPDHQKKGIGRALVNAVEEMAKSSNLQLCLETVGETNIKIYGSMGYTVQGSQGIESVEGPEFLMYSLSKKL